MKTRHILLQDLQVQASIGMLDHERTARQPLHIDATFETDAGRPVVDANIDTVLDYRLLRDLLIEECTTQHTDLLETLVDRILDRVLQEFPSVLQVRVRICKPQAFADCAQVCIEQSRRRLPL